VHKRVVQRDTRSPNYFNFETRREKCKLVFRRYASLYFVLAVDNDENEMGCFGSIHLLVEMLDSFFNGVCELDLIYQFPKVLSLVDEYIVGGEIQETSIKKILGNVERDQKFVDTALMNGKTK